MDAIILWDLDDDAYGNVAHIAEHGISVEEFEEVFFSLQTAKKMKSRATERPMAIGETSTGNTIAIVWEEVDDDPRTVLPVTAYEVEGRRWKSTRRRGG